MGDKPQKYEDRKPGTGDFTGKCWRCGSRNLWDDNCAYGCNDCGMMRVGIEPKVVRHRDR